MIITETEVAYVFTFADESTIVIPKEQVFCLVITPQQETTDIYSGETLKFDYVVKGASAEDELLVDILNIVPDYGSFQDSKVIPDKEDTTKGVIEITSQNPWTDGVQYKIFIHAANGKGKTDTKVIVLTAKAFDAVFDVALEAAAGGEYAFEVKSNSPFNVVTTVDWITAAETKANYEWTGTITIAPNETNVYRSGFVQVIYNDWGGVAKEFYVLQEPAGDKATSISYIKYNIEDGTEGVKANHLTVIAAGKKTAVVTDGSESSNTYKYLILENVATQLEVGKVYDFVGTVVKNNTDRNDTWLTDVTATEVTGVEPVEWNFMDNYQYMNANTRFRTTIIYGVLEKENDIYCIKNLANETRPFIIDDAPFALDELVGKTVFLNAYKLYYHRYTDVTPNIYDIHVIATEVKAFELKEATTSLDFSFDKYYSFGIKPAEGISYTYNYFKVEDPTAEGAYATKSDIENAYSSSILNMLRNINSTYSVENYVNDYIWCKGETTISIRSTMEPVGDDEWLEVEAPAGTQFNVLAWAWDKDGPTGEYILKTIEKEAIPYENYLGFWRAAGGVWKIEEKTADKTYKVKGVFGDWNAELEFKYDGTVGKLVIPSQDMYSPTEWNGEYYVRVLDGPDGYFDPSNTTYEHVGEDIAAMFLNKDGYLEFKTLSQKFPNENVLIQAEYNITTGQYNGMYVGYYMGWASSIDPSEAYLAWGGNWKLGDTVITITPEENSDIYYTVTGLHPKQNVTLRAQFDMETNNVIIYGYQYAQGESEYTKDGHKYHYYAIAKTADGGLWVTGDKLVTLVMDEEGKVEVQPGTYQTDEMDEPAEYSAFGLAGFYAPTDDWDWESDNAVWYNLPATLEKADAAVSVASVKQNKVELKAAPAAAKSSTKSVKKERPMTLKEFRARLAK